MSYYIPNDEPVQNKGAVQIKQPGLFEEVPEDKALICEVYNFIFKANGLCYSQDEFDAFTYPGDDRPKKWFLMDKGIAHKLSGYKD